MGVRAVGEGEGGGRGSADLGVKEAGCLRKREESWKGAGSWFNTGERFSQRLAI